MGHGWRYWRETWLAAGWTLLVVVLLSLGVGQSEKYLIRSARENGRSLFKLIVMARAWNAKHGGVYVFVGKGLFPNPYLVKKDRDLTLPDGRVLTRINPAYMTRLISEMHQPGNVSLLHITSLLPIRPANLPDEWERRALQSFEGGVPEQFERVILNGQDTFRYMAPLRVTQACMSCHAKQGYKVGEIRGGISVNLPAEATAMAQREEAASLIVRYSLIWLLGLAGIAFYAYKRAQFEQTIKNRLLFENSLLQCIPTPIFYKDNKGRYLSCNTAFEDLLGVSRDAIVGKTVHEVSGSEAAKTYHEQDMDLLRTGGSQVYEYFVDTKEHGRRDVLFSKAVFRDSRGEAAGIIGAMTDLTDHRNLEQALLLAKKLESVGQLAAGLAHEINTPLQYVNSNLSFTNKIVQQARSLLSKGSTGGTQDLLATFHEMNSLLGEIPDALADGLSGTSRIEAIVRVMQKYGAPDSGKREMVDLHEIIADALTMASHQLKKSSIVETSFASNVPLFNCDRGELNQAFLNIILNGAQANLDAMDQSSQKGVLRIVSRLDNGWLQFEFVDTGPGIPKAQLGRIFDPLFSTRDVGHGTGLGLSTAWFIVVERYNGQLTVENNGKEGVTVTIRLPLGEVQDRF